MAESDGLCTLSSEQISYNCECYNGDQCLSCIDLESQLKEAFVEINYSQFINKLLYKKLNNGTSMNT